MNPDDFLPRSQQRFNARLYKFKGDGKPYPEARHQAHWILHNVIVHPLVGLFPGKVTTKLHDLSSKWLNHQHGRVSSPPVIEDRRAWLRHNIVSHILIGLVPCEETFMHHDRTAYDMDVKGWV